MVSVEVLWHGTIIQVRKFTFISFFIKEKVVDIYQIYVSYLLKSFLLPVLGILIFSIFDIIQSICAPFSYFTRVTLNIILSLTIIRIIWRSNR
jgi:hypothetical protein